MDWSTDLSKTCKFLLLLVLRSYFLSAFFLKKVIIPLDFMLFPYLVVAPFHRIYLNATSCIWHGNIYYSHTCVHVNSIRL
jgi:hypothetical protein